MIYLTEVRPVALRVPRGIICNEGQRMINIKDALLFLLPSAFMLLMVACGGGSQTSDTPTLEAKPTEAPSTARVATRAAEEASTPAEPAPSATPTPLPTATLTPMSPTQTATLSPKQTAEQAQAATPARVQAATPTPTPNVTKRPANTPTGLPKNTAAPLPADTPTPYEAAISTWTSHEDVGDWLEENFIFDTSRQDVVLIRNKEQGTVREGNTLLVRNPSSLFKNKEGYCGDSGYFALDALNKINPAYNARWVLIKNGMGPPNHWVTGFSFRGKLYIMDYGAGHAWSEMMGIHGPYDTLSDYSGFLSSLNLNRFSVALVKWFDPVPVTVD